MTSRNCEEKIAEDGQAAFKGLSRYPCVACTSVNSEISFRFHRQSAMCEGTSSRLIRMEVERYSGFGGDCSWALTSRGSAENC